MIVEKRSFITAEDTSFESVLNSACERLWSKHSQHSIRRIQELGEELDILEKELDQFLNTSLSAKAASEK